MATDRRSLRVVGMTVIGLFVPHMEDVLGQKGHRLVGVLTAPGPKSRRTDGYLDVAQHARPGLDVLVSNYPNRWADMIRPLKPDLIWVAAFNWKIPADVLGVPPLGVINRHDALLPKYRGRNATGWALRNDEPEYGVTVHYMTPNFDDGPVISQRHIPITDDDYDFESLRSSYIRAATEVALDALDKVAAGDPGIPQDESQATHTQGVFEPEWRHIDWTAPARNIFLQVRSWYGARDVPRGAFGKIDGETMLVTKTQLVDQSPTGLAPGTVIQRGADGILIQCGDRPLLLLEALTVASDGTPHH